ncbi:MAG: 50S ribosomal protein L18 [Gammaproteobacteria bacterium]|nr:MAG: 50S ribosomal protein L18 [Gammaproteobacteria bacterium]
MINNKPRIRRAIKARKKILKQKAVRLSVFRTNKNIYAQIISDDNLKTLISASTLSPEIKTNVKSSSNIEAARKVGQQIAEKAQKVGIKNVAFDRSGFHYHGRVKALAEAAREAGLKF